MKFKKTSRPPKLFEIDETQQDSCIKRLFELRTTKNNDRIYPIIKKWKRSDKERLVFFLKSLL